MRHPDVLATIGETPLVGLPRLSPSPDVRLWAKLEGQNPTGSLKDRIALAMIEDAERRGGLTRERVLLEPSSGNTGIALALVARRKGYRLTVVMPDNAGAERRKLLRLFGAEVIPSPGSEGSNGAIRVAQELAAADPTYCLLFQYGNPVNVAAHYETTGAEIVRDLPGATHFVAGLGTGGTLMGVGRRLKEHDPEIQVVAAEPALNESIYGLRSMDAGFVPPILDPDLLDRKILVGAAESVRAARRLLGEEGIFAGPSSGAVLHVALRVAGELARGDIVCLLADGGWKYFSTGAWDDEPGAEERVGERLWW